MAVLTNGGARIVLPAHGVLGRSFTCTVRLESGKVSSEHVRLAYKNGTWTVRDLSSKNGTFVNGDCLLRGASRELAQGDRLAFGDPAVIWILEDTSAPTAMARRVPGGETLIAEDGLLALPSATRPVATLFEGEGRRWEIEVEGEIRAVEDGDTIDAGGETFVLLLPVAPVSTIEASAPASAALPELSFRVSQDEEAVEVAAEGRALSPRAHHYTWLTLARARLRDRESAALAEAQRGWLFVDDLCRMLSMDENKLNVEIYRIRKDAASLGLPNAATLIERRRASRQLRLATDRLRVTTMEEPDPSPAG